MGLKGEIETRCPKGCEEFKTDIWSFVRGDRDEDLRLALMARELNLLVCPGCEKPFFPDESYVYFDPPAEILAFVYPESYREKERYWRGKMAEDFAAFKAGLKDEKWAHLEPEIYFGADDLAGLLEADDYAGEEREVMEYFAKDLGLSVYRVSPRFARRNKVPPALPYSGGEPTRAGVIDGLKKIAQANDRLTAYSRYLDLLLSSPQAGLPPRSVVES